MVTQAQSDRTIYTKWPHRWSLKASQEAVRLLGSEYVNVASDSRTVNDGKFGKIADESTWKLSPKAAMVYKCENEVCIVSQP